MPDARTRNSSWVFWREMNSHCVRRQRARWYCQWFSSCSFMHQVSMWVSVMAVFKGWERNFHACS